MNSPHELSSCSKDHRMRLLKDEITVEKRRLGEYNPGLDPKMFSLADCYLSIEWVKWTEMAKPGSLKIYGEIKVEGEYHGKGNYIYRRHGYEAETIESDGNDSYFTFSGPIYGLHNRDVGYIICNLFTEGGKPLVFDYFGMMNDPKVEKAMSIREALSWIDGRGWDNIQVESDSSMVIAALQTRGEDSRSFDMIIRDILLLASQFNSIDFNHISRSANRVAHC